MKTWVELKWRSEIHMVDLNLFEIEAQLLEICLFGRLGVVEWKTYIVFS